MRATFIRISLILPFLLVASLWAQDRFLDRPFSLKTLTDRPLLLNLHEQSTGGDLSGIFPRRDSLWRKDLPKHAFASWKGEDGFIALSLEGGYGYMGSKDLSDSIKAMDGGVFVRGYKDSVEFWVDARITNESHTSKSPASWDREFLENQDSANGDVRYSSFARYRGHLSVHLGWSRLDFGRDAAQWGPGYFNNLMLNQNAVPFPQMSVETKIGPVTVKSLYGDLLAESHSMSSANTRAKNMYAHRYELQASQNLLLAINEISIIDSINAPILFVPIVPLFMQKGQMSEDFNNGGISMDFCYRLPGWGRAYSEFFLDDMASPVSLIKNDNVQSKWAYMGGAQLIRNLGTIQSGMIAEYARVEPWVYTHFEGSRAQMSHQGIGLGAPLGPNSQVIDWITYARYKESLTTTLRTRWWWKGTDLGSDIMDPTPSLNYSTPKQFLQGAKRKFSLTPAFSYTTPIFGVDIGMQAELTFFDNPGFYTRVGFLW